MNQTKKGPDLGRVAMPIIRIMAQGGLSWADKEQCADALLAIHRHWKSMNDEAQLEMFRQAGGQAQKAP